MQIGSSSIKIIMKFYVIYLFGGAKNMKKGGMGAIRASPPV